MTPYHHTTEMAERRLTPNTLRMLLTCGALVALAAALWHWLPTAAAQAPDGNPDAVKAPNVTIVESGWYQIAAVSANTPTGAHYNPIDGLLYYGRRPSSGGGLNRINADGTVTQIATADRPAAVVVDPADGDIFLSEDYGGNIYRTAFGATGRSTWVSGFHSGDDDPVGMAFAPADYTGPIVSAGEGLVVDRGNDGPDEIWRWSPATAEGEVLIYSDSSAGGTLVDPLDITISDSAIYLVDAKGNADGAIYRLDAGPTLTLIPTSIPIAEPVGIVFDPLRGSLLVIDRATDKVLRVDPGTGIVSDVITGFAELFWAGIDISPDSAMLFVTDFGGNKVYTFSYSEAFIFDKIALPPRWAVAPTQPGGIPEGALTQAYLLRYYYGSSTPSPPPLTVSITDTLPISLTFKSETHSPAMSFSQAGQTLAWQTQQAVAPGESGVIEIKTLYEDYQPGAVLTNQAVLGTDAHDLAAEAVSQVPIFAPLLVTPGTGELCPGPIDVRGLAQPDMTVYLRIDGTPVLEVQTDAAGEFTAEYTYAGSATETLTAQACTAEGQCSAVSRAITLRPPLSFFCPQRSWWEGTPTVGPKAGQHMVFNFRNNTGEFSSQNWRIPGVYGFWNTMLHLYVCDCPPASGTTTAPSSVWVIADGVRYDPISGVHPNYTFAITGGAHNVVFWAQCGLNMISSTGRVLIDPDGYVFDVTQGFDPLDPTLHAVAGVTVTLYMSATEWGGWTPWPAHLYNNQVNPQVTGADGYFAFFTPPGFYYLQIDGTLGYQPWRSPLIQVIDEIVHVNVPYTPWSDGASADVLLRIGGPEPAHITVTVGSTVQWLAEIDPLAPPEALAHQMENPGAQPLSTLNPISNTLGWDGGMLAPGQIYRRQMVEPGLYTYHDGQGHTGQVCVTVREDVNGDGTVELWDVHAVALAWQTTATEFDVDQSGVVDIVDLMLVAGRWGWSCAG